MPRQLEAHLENGFEAVRALGPALQGGWNRGAVYLALKRQAIQISPFQGEGSEGPA
jgi:hypothetical protein